MINKLSVTRTKILLSSVTFFLDIPDTPSFSLCKGTPTILAFHHVKNFSGQGQGPV